jgi:hypothetical protein
MERDLKEEATQEGIPDSIYWERLSSLHPTDVCHRSEALYHPTHEGFLLPIYNQRYLVLPKGKRILRMEWNDRPIEEEIPSFFSLMVLVYLIDAKEVKPSHIWVSEKDLKGGSTFFRGPHRLQVEGLEAGYGRDPEGFLRAGQRLGGSEVLYGDKGFSLDVFPKIPLTYILWRGDEEFSSRVTVLFDSTIEVHFPLDIIWCMVSETSRRLLAKEQGP